VPSGPLKGAVLDKKKYDALLLKYYEHRGWTNEGIPTEKALSLLGLQGIADDLKKRKVTETKK
jgi:aldehyde:ferredoxin oxidoreductase